MTQGFLKTISHKTLLSDGAMATVLLQRGESLDNCLEKLVLTAPAKIQSIHESYLKAGSQVVLTHTFGANRIRLRHWGLADQTEAINKQAVKLLKDLQSQYSFFVAGSMGPTQKNAKDWQRLSSKAVRDNFYEQASLLFDAGVDLIVLETFSHIEELALALEVLQDLDLPLVSSIACTPSGDLYTEGRLEEVISLWQKFLPDVVGLNCSEAPEVLLSVFQKLVQTVEQPLWIKLNKGLPEEALSDAEFTKQCALFMRENLAVLGGCCGTTSKTIQCLFKKFFGHKNFQSKNI